MKKSKKETAETRRRIVTTAAAEFRRNGIDGTSLADLIAAAGLTHGGFYRHFDSKDQLVAEACAVGMETVAEHAETAACQDDGKGGLEGIVDNYLSTAHRDDDAGGCALAALGSELARADDDTRAAVSAGFLKLVEVVARHIRRRKSQKQKPCLRSRLWSVP